MLYSHCVEAAAHRDWQRWRPSHSAHKPRARANSRLGLRLPTDSRKKKPFASSVASPSQAERGTAASGPPGKACRRAVRGHVRYFYDEIITYDRTMLSLIYKYVACINIKTILLARHARKGVAPPPCEASAARQGVPPPPGVACPARRGIAANRVRRGSAAAVRSVPHPVWGEAYHPCIRARRAAVTGEHFVRSFSSNWSTDKPLCRG